MSALIPQETIYPTGDAVTDTKSFILAVERSAIVILVDGASYSIN